MKIGGQTDVGRRFLPVLISQQVILLQKSGEILHLLMFMELDEISVNF